MNNFTTKILNTKFHKKDAHGAIHMPVYDSVSFEFENSVDIENAFLGRSAAHSYTRISNPTVEYFENQIKEITGGMGVIALSSGMAAISNALFALLEQGDNIITGRYLFGNTYSLFKNLFEKFGVEVKYLDLNDIQSIKNNINDKTKVIFLETITNPQLEVYDFKAISKIAGDNNIVVMADTTLTTPYLFNSKEQGINIEVLSSTKYISGGATCVGGVIIDNGNYVWKNNQKLKQEAVKYGKFAFLTKLRREVYRNLGACLSPHNAYLQSLGLETMSLRIKKSCENTLALAKFLIERNEVSNVNYPGLQDSKYFSISKKQFLMPGSILTFDLENKDACFRFMDNLKIIRRSTNICDNRTLALHPASTIFCEYSKILKKEMAVRENMIRISVGIEDIEDLLADIKNALEVF